MSDTLMKIDKFMCDMARETTSIMINTMDLGMAHETTVEEIDFATNFNLMITQLCFALLDQSSVEEANRVCDDIHEMIIKYREQH